MNFDKIIKAVKIDVSSLGAIGFTAPRLVLCLILQFMENLSDRQFARFMAENNAGKWFAGFGLTEKTPDYTTMCKFRNKLGVKEIEKLFNACRKQLKAQGHMQEVFTFVDATALISKLQMWDERDKAISDGYEKFNNEVIEKYAKDPEVRIGAKGKSKYWFGFKKLLTQDMSSGMINRVQVVKANETDDNNENIKNVLPDSVELPVIKVLLVRLTELSQKNCIQ